MDSVHAYSSSSWTCAFWIFLRYPIYQYADPRQGVSKKGLNKELERLLLCNNILGQT